MKLARGELGSTLVETLMASALFAATAASIYPIFSEARKSGKQGDIRKYCQDVVRGKLDEYRFGKAVNPSWAARPDSFPATAARDYQDDGLPDKPQLANLSVPSRTASQVSETGGLNGTGGAQAANGFTFAKTRYNRYFPFACNGVSDALRLSQAFPATAPQRALGMRECVGSNLAWDDIATEAGPVQDRILDRRCAANQADLRISSEIPGFKLYVKLERSSPAWNFAPSGNANKDLQYHNTCPNSGAWNRATGGTFTPSDTSNMYDFDGVTEGIQVTVTGVMDTEAAGAHLRNFAGMPTGSVDSFVCAAQSTVYPETFPVRYYLSNDGRIYPVQGGGVNGVNNAWIFPSLYTQSASVLSSSITSFAVHPRNASVYVLRQGFLTRYGNCGGQLIDCVVQPGNNGISDNGTAGWANVQEFPINPAIRFIAVDFTNNILYGMTGGLDNVLRINIACLQNNPNCGTAAGPAVLTQISYVDLQRGQFPRPPTAFPGRLSGFFLAPGGDEAFVSDYSSSVTFGASAYSASIFRATDRQLLWPLARMPVAALTFSK